MVCFRSPGRLNIIGEHTDYNDGFVLPFAINLYVKACVGSSDVFTFTSEDFEETFVFESVEKTGRWTDYIMGVIDGFIKKGFEIPPISIDISATLPMGAGLSSSSALTTATALAIDKHLGLGLDRKEIFEICVHAEREFVGVKGGIMDQFTSLFAKEGYAILLDNLTMDFEYVPLNLGGYRFFVVDSNVKHTLSDGGYNKRREEADEVLKVLSKKSHRDLSFEDLYDLKGILRKRARHVMEENERVLKAVESLKDGDLKTLGNLLYQSHASLRDLYEVSCDETDYIVDFLKNSGVVGARMVGGGFGGGVIALSKPDYMRDVFKDLRKRYFSRFGIEPTLLEVGSSDSAREVEA